MLEDFSERVQESWSNFLDWSAEKGLPLKGAADALEDKGIPSLPAFVLVLLLIIGGAAFFLAGGTQLFAPQNAAVKITVLSDGDLPLPDATVYLVSSDATQPRLEALTDESGIAYFKNVPVGATYSIRGVNKDQATLDFAWESSKSLTVSKNSEDNAVSLKLSPAAPSNLVRVTLSATGPAAATFFVYDADTGAAITDSKTGPLVAFDLDPRKSYKFSASASGYNTVTRTDSVGAADVTLAPFVLTEKLSDTTGTLRVQVLDAASGLPVPNATVDVSDDLGKSLFPNLKTGANGQAPAQTVRLGTNVVVSARALGFESQTADATEVQTDTPVVLSLQRVSQEVLRGLTVNVVDESGVPLLNPTIRLYDAKNKVQEQSPSNGSAVFPNLEVGDYYVTAYKSGYLPAFSEGAKRGTSLALQLKGATDSNSATVRVSVTNPNQEPAAEASVSLLYENGRPLGIPEKYASADGTVDFQSVPLASLYAAASLAGRQGKGAVATVTLEGTGEDKGVSLFSISLQPAKSKIFASVRDHYTNQTVEGANVEFSVSGSASSPAVSCTTKQGKCSADLLEGFYVARIRAAGYAPFLSSEFEVVPGSPNKQTFGLVPSGAATDQLVFAGFFDLQGNKASSLAPLTAYNAKFLLTSPPVGYTTAQMQVRIGGADSSLDSEPAEIVGYEAGTAIVDKGAQYDLNAATPTPTPTSSPSETATPTAQAARLGFASAPVGMTARHLDFASVTDNGLKYVQFTFQPFEGTKEVTVQIQTKPQAQGTVSLQYRSAFDTPREPLRDPADATAAKGALLANMKTASSPISFGGICQDTACIDYHFEGANGKEANGYDAQIGETFSLNFQLAAAPGATLELSAPSSDPSISLREGTAGNSRSLAKESGDNQFITLDTTEANPSGRFLIDAKRLASSVSLQLQVKSGDTQITRPLTVSVVGPKPDLKVTLRPTSLTALQANSVTFTVADSSGAPVANAYVAVGSGSDALRGAVFEGTYAQAKDGTATYKVDGIEPPAIGTVSYKVQAEGFKTKSGTLQVTAADLFALDTASLSISVDSYDGQSATVSFHNLLDNEVPVSLQVQANANPKYTETFLDLSSLRLKPKETRSVTLQARVSDSILPVATLAQTLAEKVTGRITITAHLGNVDQQETLPFTINTAFTQQDLDALWTSSQESLQFSLNPPAHASDSQTLVVANNAQYPLVVNLESSLSNVYFQPLSATVSAGQSAEFLAVARATPLDPCDKSEDNRQGTVTVHASALGITSSKRLPLAYAATSSESCRDVHAGQNATPTPESSVSPTPTPTPIKTCALTLDPERIFPANTTKVTVNYYEQATAPNVIIVNCGNGRTANAVGCTGTTGTCTASCYYANPGTYSVSAPRLSCQSASLQVVPITTTITPTPVGYCSSDYKCQDDEKCESNTCTVLSCGENELATAHQCKPQPIVTYDVNGGVRVALPIQIVVQFPQNTQKKDNPDGSTYLILPNQDTMLFESDARVDDSSTILQNTPYSSSLLFNVNRNAGKLVAIVPAGTFFEIPAKYARQIPVTGFNAYTNQVPALSQAFTQYGWDLRFPVSVYLDFPSQTDFNREGSMQTASVDQFDITYPLSSQTYRPYSSQERRVLVNPGNSIRVQLTPFVTSQDSIDVSFPVETTFNLEQYVRVKTDSFSGGGKALQLQSGATITLPSDAIVSSDANDFKKVQIPAGSPVRVPPGMALVDPAMQVNLQLPFTVTFRVREESGSFLSLLPDGVNAKSLGTESVVVNFPAAGARAGLKAPDGSRRVDVLPLTPMVFGLPNFGIDGGGTQKKLPIGFSMTLPPNANTRTSSKDQSLLVEFPNGWQMLLSGATLAPGNFVQGRKLDVHAGTPVTFSRNLVGDLPSDYGMKSFSVKFPADALLHFGNDAHIVKNRVVGSNYEVGFDEKPSFDKTELGNDVFVSNGQTVSFTWIDPGLKNLLGKDFPFDQIPFDLDFSIPSDKVDRVIEERDDTGALMQSVRVGTACLDDFTIEDPASHDKLEMNIDRIMAKEMTEGVPTVDERTFTIPSTTKFVPNICKDTDTENLYQIRATFTSMVGYVLPPGTAEYGGTANSVSRRINLNGCRTLSVNIRDKQYVLPQVQAIWFPESGVTADPRKTPDQSQVVSVERGKTTTIVLCDKPLKKPGTPGSISFGQPLGIMPYGQPITFTNANAGATQEAKFCIYNRHAGPVNVFLKLTNADSTGKESGSFIGPTSQTFLEGASIVDLDDAVRGYTIQGHWDKDSGVLKLPASALGQGDSPQSACPSGEPGSSAQVFSFTVAVPDKYLENGCLKKSAELRDISGKIGFFYQGNDLLSDGPQYADLKIALKNEGGECAGDKSKQLSKALGDFYVNYAEQVAGTAQKNAKTGTPIILVFKDVDHKRYLTMVNNLDEAVQLSIKSDFDGGEFVKCTLPADGNLKSGSGFISECTSTKTTKTGQGFIEISYTGAISKKTQALRVNAKVDALEAPWKDLFKSTPMGDLAKQDDAPAQDQPNAQGANAATGTGGKQPAAKPKLAPLQSLLFAPAPAEPQNPAAGTPAAPTGSVPGTAILVPLDAAVMKCQTNFCTSGQVKAALTGFGNKLAEFVNSFYSLDEAKFRSGLNSFCQKPGLADHNTNQYFKSIVVQSANSRVSLAELTEALKSGLGELAAQGNKKMLGTIKPPSLGSMGQLGCGIYVVKARVGLCQPFSGSKDDWLRSSEIDFSVATAEGPEFKACEETLANAALLTSEKTEVVVGREPVHAPSFLKDIELNLKLDKDASLLNKIKVVSLGPYRDANNQQDASNAQALATALYGTASPRVSPSLSYSDAPYCYQHLGYASASVVAASAPAILIQAFSAGVNPTGLASSLRGFVTSLSLCAGTATINYITAGTKNTQCDVANSCAQASTYYLLNAYLSTIPGLTLPSLYGPRADFVKEFATFTAISGGAEVIGGATHYFTGNPDKYVVSPSLVGPAGSVYMNLDAIKNLRRLGLNPLKVGSNAKTLMSTTEQANALKQTATGLVSALGPLLTYADVRPVRAELDPTLGNHVVVFNNPERKLIDLPVSMKEICIRDPKSDSDCFNEIDADTLCPGKVPYCFYLVKGAQYNGVQQYDLIAGINGKTDATPLGVSFFDASQFVAKGSIEEGGIAKSAAFASYGALGKATNSDVGNVKAGEITSGGNRQTAENLLARYQGWCDGYTCPKEVRDAIKKAQAAIDKHVDAGYLEAVTLLTQSVQTPAS